MGACGAQERDLLHTADRGHHHQRNRDVDRRRGHRGPVHRSRHRRLPHAQREVPAPQLNIQWIIW